MKKVCIVCNIPFLDHSKWKRGQTCSKACSSTLSVNKRYSEGTYVRSQEACRKDLETKRQIRQNLYNEVSKEELISIYEKILEGSLSRFPLGILQFGNYKQRGIILIKYLVEEKMNLSTDEEILSFLTLENLKKYKLGSQVLIKCFDNDMWTMIETCYPGRFKKVRRRRSSSQYGNSANKRTKDSVSKEELINLCREKSKNYPNIVDFFTNKNLKELNLYSLVRRHFTLLFDLVEACYPGRFKKWEKKNQNNLWSKGSTKNYELAREATRWLVEDILKLTPHTLVGKVNNTTFKEYGLDSMLACIYNSSYVSALLDCYSELTRSLFPQTQLIANLGYEFEAVCRDILLRNNLNIINKTFKTKSLNCPDLIFSQDHWGDIKISTSAFYNSRTEDYLKYCKKLTIVYLVKNASVKNTERIGFISLDKLVPLNEADKERLSFIKKEYFRLLRE